MARTDWPASPVSSVIKNDKLVIRPLPGLPVIRDLVVDMTQFYKQYERIKPYLQNDDAAARHRAPAIAGRSRQARRPLRMHPVRLLLLELSLVLVESLTSSLVRPACCRRIAFLADSRDTRIRRNGLSELEDPVQRVPLPRHHELRRGMPEGSQPDASAIGHIRNMLLERAHLDHRQTIIQVPCRGTARAGGETSNARRLTPTDAPDAATCPAATSTTWKGCSKVLDRRSQVRARGMAAVTSTALPRNGNAAPATFPTPTCIEQLQAACPNVRGSRRQRCWRQQAAWPCLEHEAKQVNVVQLISSYRMRGHQHAQARSART